jgi:hypothetical protein
MPAFKNLIGQRFGKLVVKERALNIYRGKISEVVWNCICDCGIEKNIRSRTLIRGDAKSCGCSQKIKGNDSLILKDLTGQKFGKLTALNKANDNVWKCKCDCGNEYETTTFNLIRNKIKSCGCSHFDYYKQKDIKENMGKKFGRLTAIEFIKSEKKRHFWKFLCDCGKEHIADMRSVIRGDTTSCGCYKSEVAVKNGHKNKKELKIIDHNDYYEIFLDTYNISFLIDKEDIWITKYPICARKSSKRKNSSYYILIDLPIKKCKYKRVLLSRFLLGILDNNKVLADHEDRNTLNNCKNNLRIATKCQNAQNSLGCGVDGKKGSYLRKRGNRLKYESYIRCNNKTHFLGAFNTDIEAKIAYDIAALKYHNEFACLNFPEKIEKYKQILNNNLSIINA